MRETVARAAAIRSAALEEAPGQGALQRAFAALRENGVETGRLGRVSVEADGTLHLEADAGGARRWFGFSEGELTEHQPLFDQRIPLLVSGLGETLIRDHALVSYRPGRRVVFAMAGNPGRPGVVKGYRSRRGKQAKIRHEIATDANRAGGFEVPALFECAAGDECLAMDFQPGDTPDTGPGSEQVWYMIGSRLRRFQSGEANVDMLQPFDSTDELAVLDERARRFLLCVPAVPAGWCEGRERLEETAGGLPAVPLCPAHRDLHDGQFLVAGKSITLLDFDLLCRADPALDAGNLLAHLVLRELQRGREPGVSGAGRAFLSGLDREDEPAFEQRRLFYQAATFYRLALLYALRPRWSSLVPALIAEGRRCLDRSGTTRARS